jgi:hypothetical protein
VDDFALAAEGILTSTIEARACTVLLPTVDGGFARGALAIASTSAVLPRIRRTVRIVRCGGRRADVPLTSDLAKLGQDVVLIPAERAGRLLAMLAVVPSNRAPLLSRTARELLLMYGEIVAVIGEKLTESAAVARIVSRRTRELVQVIADLEASRVGDPASSGETEELKTLSQGARPESSAGPLVRSGEDPRRRRVTASVLLAESSRGDGAPAARCGSTVEAPVRGSGGAACGDDNV